MIREVTLDAVADTPTLSAMTAVVTGAAGVADAGESLSVGPLLLLPNPRRQMDDFLETVGVVAEVGDGGVGHEDTDDFSDRREEVSAEIRV
jgi:hypothetical protein